MALQVTLQVAGVASQVVPTRGRVGKGLCQVAAALPCLPSCALHFCPAALLPVLPPSASETALYGLRFTCLNLNL